MTMKFKSMFTEVSKQFKKMSYKDLISINDEAGEVYEGEDIENYDFYYNEDEKIFYHYDPESKLYGFYYGREEIFDKSLDKLHKKALIALN